MDAGSEAGESRVGSGNLPTSTSIFESIIGRVTDEYNWVVCSGSLVNTKEQVL